MKAQSPPNLTEALGVKPGDLVALVGGGGKTSLMYALAKEARAAGLRVAVATTTKILPPPETSGFELFLPPNLGELAAADFSPSLALKVIGSRLREDGKVIGIPPEWCDALASSGRLDLLIIEADGSRGLPLKAPGKEEPVVPAATTLFVALTGLGALGKPLGECAFRAERASALSETPPDALVTPQTLAKLLCHPLGLGKGRPAAAHAVAFLNQCDAADPALARQTCELTLAPGSTWERVVIARLDQSVAHIEAIITKRG